MRRRMIGNVDEKEWLSIVSFHKSQFDAHDSAAVNDTDTIYKSDQVSCPSVILYSSTAQ